MRIIAREDRDVRASAARRERDGIKVGDRPEPVVIASRSIRTPTREKRWPQLTRIRVEPPRAYGEERERRTACVLALCRRKGEKRGKCLGRGKGSRGGNGVNLEESRGSRELFLVSTLDPRSSPRLALLLSSVSRRVLGKLIPIKASRYATAVIQERTLGRNSSSRWRREQEGGKE